MEERRWFSLVKPAIQLKLLFILILSVIVNVLLVMGLGWFIVTESLVNKSAQSILEAVSTQFWFFVMLLVLGVIGVTVLFSYLFLRECNRLVGPIYRVTNELEEIHETGDVQPISVRSGDHFQDLVKMLNLVLLDLSND